MKHARMISNKKSDRYNTIITMVILIFSLLTVCQNSAFIFNPFILVLLCISYVISFYSVLIVGGVSILIGFLIEKTYGLELLLIVILIILFYSISILFNNEKIKIYMPCISTNLILLCIYFLTSNNVFYAINSIVLSLISIIFSIHLMDVIIKKRNQEKVNELAFSLMITFIIGCFSKIENIVFFSLILFLIILLKINKKMIFLMTTLSSFMLLYLFSNTSINVLMCIYLPLFLLGIIETKYCYYFYLPIAVIFMFSINETFYLDLLFYQILFGYIFALVLPKFIVDKIDLILYDTTSNKLNTIIEYQRNKLNDISHLCDLLMDDRFDKFEGLDKILEKVIVREVCNKCSSQSECKIKISKYLSGYLSNNEKTEIVNSCLYPYQLTKGINTANKRIVEYSEREVKSVESRQTMNKTYEVIRKYIDLQPQIQKNKKNYYLEISTLTKEADDSPNGDSFEIYNDDYQSKIILSDGMGHTSKSRDISQYVIELINYLHQISNDTSNSIESCNQIIIAKTYEEVYATLDLCEFDLENGIANIYKAGSFPTYLIRNRQVQEISTKLPPIGIISNIKVNPEIIQLRPNDILLFITDGFGEQVKEILEKTSQKSIFLPLKNYVKFLFKKLSEEIKIEDDRTILAVKIIKN